MSMSPSPRADKSESQSPTASLPQPLLSTLATNAAHDSESVDTFGLQQPLDPESQPESTSESPSGQPKVSIASGDVNQATLRQISVPKNSLFGYEMPIDLISATYAALVAAGGIMGYAKAGSVPSLVAGLAFGSLLGIGAYMTSVNPNNYYLTYGTSTLLGGYMGSKYLKSGKFMPSGLVALLSVGIFLRCSLRVYQNYQVAHRK